MSLGLIWRLFLLEQVYGLGFVWRQAGIWCIAEICQLGWRRKYTPTTHICAVPFSLPVCHPLIICVSISHPCGCLSVHQSVFVVCLSVSDSACCLSVNLSLRLVFLSLYPSVSVLPVCSSVCLSVSPVYVFTVLLAGCLSVLLSVPSSLSLCLPFCPCRIG